MSVKHMNNCELMSPQYISQLLYMYEDSEACNLCNL